jgi:hypothetical protein
MSEYSIRSASINELGSLPSVIFSTTKAYFSGHIDLTPSSAKCAISFIGGAGAPKKTYLPVATEVVNGFSGRLAAHLPRRIITHTRQIDDYLGDIVPKFSEFNILAGHSIGGYVALRGLHLHPDKVQLVILIDTPINRKEIPELHHNLMMNMMGIDLMRQPGALDALDHIQETPILRSRVLSLGSEKSIVPWKTTVLPGIENRILEEPAHLNFHQHPEAITAIKNATENLFARNGGNTFEARRNRERTTGSQNVRQGQDSPRGTKETHIRSV